MLNDLKPFPGRNDGVEIYASQDHRDTTQNQLRNFRFLQKPLKTENTQKKTLLSFFFWNERLRRCCFISSAMKIPMRFPMPLGKLNISSWRTEVETRFIQEWFGRKDEVYSSWVEQVIARASYPFSHSQLQTFHLPWDRGWSLAYLGGRLLRRSNRRWWKRCQPTCWCAW